MALAPQEYWEATWEGRRPERGFAYFDELAAHLPRGEGLEFLEVGCAPGGILAEFCGRLGYVAHGIDYASEPAPIESYLRGEGVRVGEIHQGDFLTWEPGRRYDIVASFGFIEHFEEPAAVVDRHFRLARPGGTVVLTMPHYARGQKLLHWLFDRENLRRHNTGCMNLKFLREAAERNGAEIVAARYTGGHFGFWCDRPRSSWLGTRLRWGTEMLLERLAKRLPGDANPWLSPDLYAVYRLR
jgi:SAM-dependent methyltransferase